MGANSPSSQKPYVCGNLGALWQKRRFATRFELLYPSRESRKRDAAIRLIPKKTRGRAALPLTACFLSLRSSQQGNGRQAARFTCRQALVHLLLLFPENLTPLRALRFSGAPLLRALIPLCAQIHSFRICLSAYWGQKRKLRFPFLREIISVHTFCFELTKQKVVIFRTTPLPSLCSGQSEFSSPRDNLGARILHNRAVSPFLQKQKYLQIRVRI